jgi:hypothetical protein
VIPLEEQGEMLGNPLPGESGEQRAQRVCASRVNYDGPWQQQIQPAARTAGVYMLAAGKLAPLSLFYLVSGGIMLLLTFVSSALTL